MNDGQIVLGPAPGLVYFTLKAGTGSVPWGVKASEPCVTGASVPTAPERLSPLHRSVCPHGPERLSPRPRSVCPRGPERLSPRPQSVCPCCTSASVPAAPERRSPRPRSVCPRGPERLSPRPRSVCPRGPGASVPAARSVGPRGPERLSPLHRSPRPVSARTQRPGMGAVASKCVSDTGVTGLEHSKSNEDSDQQPIIEKDEVMRRGSTRRHSSGETVHCPTCQGTGRIPRGQESKLVAVIPCNDQRLRPRHTKLYVAVSVGVCFLVSFLVLFFLFPRSVLLSSVAVKSSFVYFTKDEVQIDITNVLNITNHNFAPVQAYNLSVQALNFDTVVGTVSIKNVTSVKPLSIKMYPFVMPIKLTDEGLSNYCKKASLPVHILYLHLQISMTVYYLAHYEQLSLETYEYIDCGANSTIPHHAQPPPP